METIIIIVFVLGYLAITLEHNLHIDKHTRPGNDGHFVGDDS